VKCLPAVLTALVPPDVLNDTYAAAQVYISTTIFSSVTVYEVTDVALVSPVERLLKSHFMVFTYEDSFCVACFRASWFDE
jgi:hypothetical protein